MSRATRRSVAWRPPWAWRCSGELEKQQGAGGHLVHVPDREAGLLRAVGEIRVRHKLPLLPAGGFRKLEVHHVLPGVEHDEERRLLAPAADSRGLRAAIKEHPEAAHVRVLPMLFTHFLAGGIDPCHILDLERLVVFAGEEAGAPEDGITVPEAGELAHKGNQALGAVVVVPVDPGDLVVLAI